MIDDICLKYIQFEAARKGFGEQFNVLEGGQVSNPGVWGIGQAGGATLREAREDGFFTVAPRSCTPFGRHYSD